MGASPSAQKMGLVNGLTTCHLGHYGLDRGYGENRFGAWSLHALSQWLYAANASHALV